jgi:hypothetical protein
MTTSVNDSTSAIPPTGVNSSAGSGEAPGSSAYCAARDGRALRLSLPPVAGVDRCDE